MISAIYLHHDHQSCGFTLCGGASKIHRFLPPVLNAKLRCCKRECSSPTTLTSHNSSSKSALIEFQLRATNNQIDLEAGFGGEEFPEISRGVDSRMIESGSERSEYLDPRVEVVLDLR